MVNIDTRPEQVGKVIAYRENSLELEYIIVGDLTGVTVGVELQNSSGMKEYSVETFELVGNSVFISFTKEQVAKMPAIAKCQVILNDVYKNGFEIKPDRGFGTPSNTSATVQVNLKGPKGDKGESGDQSDELIALAADVTEKHANVEAEAEAISLTAIQIETKRQEVAGNTQVVLEAKEDIEAALNSDVTVDTYAQAVALFTGALKRTIFINQASVYNDPGEYFIWFPAVQKAAHMGLDFNYTE